MLEVRTLLRPVAMYVLLMFALVIIGCGKPPDLRDQRLAEFARESMTEQRQQNDRMAEQSVAVVAGSRQLAEAAQELVLQDATARRELLAAQTELTSQLHDQRSRVDVGRDQLEQERRQIAAQRTRDPLLAAAIYDVGLVLVSVLPLMRDSASFSVTARGSMGDGAWPVAVRTSPPIPRATRARCARAGEPAAPRGPIDGTTGSRSRSSSSRD